MPEDFPELRTDPEFAKLDVANQKYVYSYLYAQKFIQDPAFAALDEQNKRYVIENVADRAEPILEQPDNPQFASLIDYAKRMRNGEDVAKEAALALTGASAVAQLSLTNLFRPVLDKMLEVTGNDVGREILNTIVTTKEEKKDFEKAMGYLESSFPLVGEAKRLRRVKLGTAVGMLTDFASWYAVTGPVVKMGGMLASATKAGKALGMAGGSFVGAGKNMATETSKWLWKRALPETLESVRGGMIGVARENILGNIEDELGKNPELYDIVYENSKTFGEYFIGDMIGFGVLSILGKGLGKVSKAFKGTAKAALSGLDDGIEEVGKTIPKRGLLNDADFDYVRDIFTKTDGINITEISKLPAQKRLRYERLALMAERMKRVEKLTPTEKTELMLYSKGYDVQPRGEKFVLHRIDDGTEDVFGTWNEAVGRAATEGAKRFEFKGSKKDAIDLLGGSNDVRIKEVIRVHTQDLNLSQEGLAKYLTPENGVLRSQNVTHVASELMHKAGVRIDDINNTKIVKVKDYFKKGRQAADDVIEVPEVITTAKEQSIFVKRYLDQIDALSQKYGGSPNPLSDAKKSFTDVLKKTPANPLYVDSLAKKYVNGGYIRHVKGQAELLSSRGLEVRGSVNDIQQFILEKHIAPAKGVTYIDMIKGHADKNFGAKISYNKKSGEIMVIRNNADGKKFRQPFDSVDDMLERLPEFEPKLPIEAAPDFNITTRSKSGSKAEFNATTIRGDVHEVAKFLDSFDDASKTRKTVNLRVEGGNLVKLDVLSRRYQVELPDVGIKLSFSTLDDAKAALKKGTKHFDDLSELALKKGLRLEMYRGGYVIYGNGQKKVVDTILDAKTYMKSVAEPDWVGKEITSMSPEMNSEIQKAYREWFEDGAPFQENIWEIGEKIRKHVMKTDGDTRFWTDAQQTFGAADWNIQNIAKDIGRPDYLRAFYNMEEGRQLAEGSVANFLRLYKRSMPKMNVHMRERLGMVLRSETEPAKWNALYQKTYGADMPDVMVEAASRLQKLLGDTPESGLFSTFGMDGWKFVTHYLPRIRSKFKELGEAGLPANADVAVTHAMGWHKMPVEIKPFFENMRTSEFLAFSNIKDIDEIMRLYVRKGYQKVHLESAGKEIQRVLDTKMPDEAFGRLNAYYRQVTGMQTTHMDEAVKATVKKGHMSFIKLMQKTGLIKQQSPKVMEDIIGFANQFTIGATMALRISLVIRNLHQPYITIGSRWGMDVVTEGTRRAVVNGGDIVSRLKSRGQIPDKAPLMDLVGMGPSKMLQKFNHVGMKAYQSADAFNRGVADQVADVLMSNATARMIAGEIDANKFVKLARLNRLDDLSRKEILEAMNKGDYLGARDLYANRIIYETQFPYKVGTNPAVFEGTLGRLFGGFGHYPVYFASNIARGFQHLPAGQKMAMVGRYMATMYAMKKSWEFLGVDYRNFLWYTPFQFEGGPYSQLINTALASTGDGYEGKRAREELKRSIPRLFVPGYGFASSVVKGIDAAGEGKNLTALGHFMSLPIDDSQF